MIRMRVITCPKELISTYMLYYVIEKPFPVWTVIGVVDFAFPEVLVEIRANARMS